MTTSTYVSTQSLSSPPPSALDMSEARMVCTLCDGGGRVNCHGLDDEISTVRCPTCKGSGHVSPDEQLIAMAEAGAGEPVEDWTEAAGAEWAPVVAAK